MRTKERTIVVSQRDLWPGSSLEKLVRERCAPDTIVKILGSEIDSRSMCYHITVLVEPFEAPKGPAKSGLLTGYHHPSRSTRPRQDKRIFQYR